MTIYIYFLIFFNKPSPVHFSLVNIQLVLIVTAILTYIYYDEIDNKKTTEV